jgi:D-alanyl-D-alanine dipeptidase
MPVDTYHLVDLADKGILFDIRYATPDNFTHCQLYPFAKAYLHKDATAQLLRVQEDLRSRGLELKVFDAYRPLSVQQKMWDLIHDERYVSNPTINGGRHTRGTAVDITLVDSQGNKLDMPTDFDDFTDKAHQDYSDLSENQKNNRTLLREVMEKYGFEPHPFEWWHFDLKGWQNYPVLDVDFIALAPKL